MATPHVPTGSVPGVSSPSAKLAPSNVSKSTRSLPVPGYYTGVPLHLLQAAQNQSRLRKNGLDPLHSGASSPVPGGSSSRSVSPTAAAAMAKYVPAALTRGGAPAGLVAGNGMAGVVHPGAAAAAGSSAQGNGGSGLNAQGSMSFDEFVRFKTNIDDARAGPAAAVLVGPDYKRQAELLKEKERLHEQSIAMVQKWNNTIAGQRKIRLAAQHEKTKAAEEQRQQMDRDWAVVKQAERQAQVDRAKKMQYLEDARVRQLNSQALITQVLKVNDCILATHTSSL
ncbi:hypothetical protein BC828DRAFT_393759 [Blastocladiella britannica]|nr:hypothetical protein BC828DRAFT_393759 [Blastocladiella britannica]